MPSWLICSICQARSLNAVIQGNPVQFAMSKSAGAISIGYSAPDVGFASNHEGYALSTYGQEYLRLRKLVGVHVMVIP